MVCMWWSKAAVCSMTVSFTGKTSKSRWMILMLSA
ncbi:Uncharacterised protein [Mycobacterium tuberculosis]|nr:Uncharacterised protein [Mycobacterium tuberculosis]